MREVKNEDGETQRTIDVDVKVSPIGAEVEEAIDAEYGDARGADEKEGVQEERIEKESEQKEE